MNTKKTFLTKEQEKYIDDNWQQFTHEQIGVKIGLPVSAVSNYCTRKGYRKMRGRKKMIKALPKKIINYGPERTEVKRPRADHDNVSREQHVEKWINMNV